MLDKWNRYFNQGGGLDQEFGFSSVVGACLGVWGRDGTIVRIRGVGGR